MSDTVTYTLLNLWLLIGCAEVRSASFTKDALPCRQGYPLTTSLIEEVINVWTNAQIMLLLILSDP